MVGAFKAASPSRWPFQDVGLARRVATAAAQIDRA
jgi:hypothetical protein